MYDTFFDRLNAGFSGYDIWLMIVLSLVAALIMRKWPQWPAAAFIMMMVDAAAPFFYRWATGIPPNFAFDFAVARFDERGGVIVLLKLAIYFLMIGGIFFSKRRIGQR
jgi:hypothetical protein